MNERVEGVYFFFGEEEHLKQVYLSRLRAQVDEFNTKKITLTPEDWYAQLSAEIGQVSFFSARRFLEIRALPLPYMNEKEAQQLAALLSSVDDDLILVCYFFECDIPFTGNIPRTQKRLLNLPAFKNLPESVCVVNFQHPTASECVYYYDAKFKSRGVSAERAVLELFCSRGKNDMSLLENESEKLIALAGVSGGVLTREMVEEALPQASESMLYRLSDAVEGADAKRALEEYRILRAMKFDPIPILATISRTIVNLRLVQATTDGKTLEETFGIKGFRQKKLITAARRVSPQALNECAELCLNTDMKLKNTSLSADVLLEEVLVKICMKLGGRA